MHAYNIPYQSTEFVHVHWMLLLFMLYVESMLQLKAYFKL